MYDYLISTLWPVIVPVSAEKDKSLFLVWMPIFIKNEVKVYLQV